MSREVRERLEVVLDKVTVRLDAASRMAMGAVPRRSRLRRARSAGRRVIVLPWAQRRISLSPRSSCCLRCADSELILVTQNVGDFAQLDVQLLNPWRADKDS